MRSLTQRVVARFAAETRPVVQDEGAFLLEFLPKHQGAVESVVEKVHKALAMYRSAGIPVRHKVLVQLNGKGVSKHDAQYWNGKTPPLMVIAPKAYQDPILLKTIVHEFGHYVHDQVVPGGTGNPVIISRYFWAIKQKATGTGPQRDVLTKQIAAIDQELRELGKRRNVVRALPKKGQVFEFEAWASPGRKLSLKGRILQKTGDRLRIEVLNPEVIPFNISGYFPKRNGVVTYDTFVDSVFSQGPDPEVEALIKKKEAERKVLFEELGTYSRTEKDDRYEAQRHEWAPTAYSRKNAHEWFAELCTTYVLGHLKAPVDEWLLSVIKTGDAPAGFPSV